MRTNLLPRLLVLALCAGCALPNMAVAASPIAELDTRNIAAPTGDFMAARSQAHLQRLNDDYVRAFLESDVAWFEEHLAPDFRCILSSGAMVDRAAFLRNVAQPVNMNAFTVEDVGVQFTAGTAIVQARTRYTRSDGTRGGSRYTDVWVLRDGRWQTLIAHITAITDPASVP